MDEEIYKQLDGIALSELLLKGDINPLVLMEIAINIAKEKNKEFNIICHEKYEETLNLAKEWQLKGIFGGIPFLLKDSGLPSQRFPSSLGSNFFKGQQYTADATLVQRFDDCGLIPFARTTVPELCMAPTTEARANGGPTLNPHNPELSAGGSSGGAAVAVATGIVPIAHGSDGGGSIRVPAAACGVYGLKPSRELIPMGPLRGEGWGGLACDGVLSRSVRDTAAVLHAIAGYERGAPYASPEVANYMACLDQPLEKSLKIALWQEPWNDILVDDICLKGVQHTAELCQDLGHEVIEFSPPPINYDRFVQAHIRLMGAHIVNSVDTWLLNKNKSDFVLLEKTIRDGYIYGKN